MSHPTGQPIYTVLRGTTSPAQIRLASYNGRRHVVVPVVALLGDAVVRPSTGKGNEFVPAKVLSKAPIGWNGRPVVPDHPSDYTSANNPARLESFSFGQVFNTVYEDGKLMMEAWIDPERTDLVGHGASKALADAQSGKPVEVSVGCYVVSMAQKGTSPKGVPYEHVWMELIPDHLAFGLDGKRGACSVEMGCGAPRSLVMADDNDLTTVPTSKEIEMNLFQRVLAALRGEEGPLATALTPDGASDHELRAMLTDALRASVPGFGGVYEMYPESNSVVYVAQPKDETEWYMADYSKNGSGGCDVSNHKRVKPKTTYEPLAEGADDVPVPDLPVSETQPPASTDLATTVPHDCKCGKHKTLASPADKPIDVLSAALSADPSQDAQKGAPSVDIKTLASALISNPATPFEEGDRATLEALTEVKLSALSEKFTPVEEPSAPAPAQLSADEVEAAYLATAPDSIKTIVERHKREESARRATLITSLSKGQKVFTVAQLSAKDTEELESLCELAGLNRPVSAPSPNYSGRVLSNSEGENGVPEPKPYDVALEARRLAEKKQ